MPFQLQISKVAKENGELAITGTVVFGAYAGPELVKICGRDGRQFTTSVVHTSVQNPQDWPILPGHKTILTISIIAPADFLIDTSQPITGYGTVFENPNRIDISHVLEDTEFWALQMGLHLACEEFEDPSDQFWGISMDTLNEYYKAQISDYQDRGIDPFLRVSLGETRYVEIECAAGVEYQDRFWIGDSLSVERALLGYHSGHFSLPAFREAELFWLSSLARSDPIKQAFILVLMTACYWNNNHTRVEELASHLAKDLPGINRETAPKVARAMSENQRNTSIKWELSGEFGWVNNSGYSQRNPQSKMSVLRPEHFQFIGRFFDDLD